MERGLKPPFHPSLFNPSLPILEIRLQSSGDQIFVDRSFSILVYSQKFMVSFGSRRKKILVIAGGGVFPKKWYQLDKRAAYFPADPT
jgi:hypothetical protein